MGHQEGAAACAGRSARGRDRPEAPQGGGDSSYTRGGARCSHFKCFQLFSGTVRVDGALAGGRKGVGQWAVSSCAMCVVCSFVCVRSVALGGRNGRE